MTDSRTQPDTCATPADQNRALSAAEARQRMLDEVSPIAGREFVPVRETGRDHHGRPVLEMLSRGSSANLSALALADGVALLPPDAELIAPGDLLSFQSLGDG